MSIYGLQLPKQQTLQNQTGPIQKNKGFANIYKTQEGEQTTSFQWKSYQKPKPEFYSKILKGDGTILSKQAQRTSQNFDVTLRNLNHQFYSTGVRQIEFNDQKYKELVNESRFREDEGVQQDQYYDIKGNTFKNTLIPAQTAFSAFNVRNNSDFKSFDDSHQNPNQTKKVFKQKVIPKYRGYLRSGQILFNNINQINTREIKTPRANSNKNDEIKQGRYVKTKAGMDLNLNTYDGALNQTNYQVWQQQTKEPRYQSSMNKLNQTFQNSNNQSYQAQGNYSPDFKHKKNELSYNYTRQPSSAYLKKDNQNENNNSNKKDIFGSHKQNESSQKNLSKSPSKAAMKDETQKMMKNWNHYDTNISNQLSVQNKIVDRKKYELDSRAQSINNYGYQPLFQKSIQKKRQIENILQGSINDINLDAPAYKRKYTPITKFQKSVIDSKIQILFGVKNR